MKIKEILSELRYPGNIGIMELSKFYKIATPEQKDKMKKLMSTDKKAAWEYLQKTLGVKLDDTIKEKFMKDNNE